VEQAQLELQLKVWKELAISKQVLMRSATDALKLDPNCTQDELKEALDAALKKVAAADSSVVTAQEQARQAIAAMEKKLATSVQAQTATEAANTELIAAQENAARQMATERANFVKEMQSLKERLAEREKALKAINTALADTPENVIKKMKLFKKEKQEEADARRLVEAQVAGLRKDKKQVAEFVDKTAKLATQYRELHTLGTQLHEQLKPLVEDAAKIPALTELDSKLLEELEQAGPKLKK
jgi:colicin import membrane protein